MMGGSLGKVGLSLGLLELNACRVESLAQLVAVSHATALSLPLCCQDLGLGCLAVDLLLDLHISASTDGTVHAHFGSSLDRRSVGLALKSL